MNTSTTFNEMPLSDGMKKTLLQIGFTAPTPIQEKSIPDLLAGFDLLGQAQTGTGKTGAFSVPLIELVNENSEQVQALVVCPTRELCLQVCQEIKRLSMHKQGLATIALYGGQSIEQQFRTLKTEMPQIVVATPGRLFDHLRRKSVSLSHVSMVVLDEADEMLDMGFRPEIEQIFDLLPEQNQRIFFSATMAKAIKDLAVNYLRDPKIIKTEAKALTVSTIAQSYYKVRPREKTELLCRILDIKEPKLSVVFCNAKSIADEIVDQIKGFGFEAGVLHGDLSQNQRDRVMAQFKAGLIRVLVATDVAARGLDIDDVELVCNYHLPHDPEDYVHRIGRTGRAGRVGCAVSLVEPRDNSRLRRICQFARIDIEEAHPPTVAQVKAAKLASLFGKIKEAISSKKIAEYRSFVSKQDLSPEDVAAGMLQMALRKFDESSNADAAFESLREKKYSGYDSEKRFKRDNNRDRGEYRARSGQENGRSRSSGSGYERRGRNPNRQEEASSFPRPKRTDSDRPGYARGDRDTRGSQAKSRPDVQEYAARDSRKPRPGGFDGRKENGPARDADRGRPSRFGRKFDSSKKPRKDRH